MSSCCFIIPIDLLRRLSRDRGLSSSQRKSLREAVKFEEEWRRFRTASGRLSAIAGSVLPSMAPGDAAPAITVSDCGHGTTLPGRPVRNPAGSADETARRAFVETSAVAEFYRKVFGRNSVDDAGRTLVSSIHYSVGYNNAFWNGDQMTYGDGDGNIFVDFTRSDDVIGHELTHGVTQFSAQLAYENEAGGLNESVSDVFGSMFRQWRANQAAGEADWLIGHDIMGPAALERGYTCLRDMSDPAAKHCLSPQPKHFSKFRKGMDPHTSSGIANFAFHEAAMAIGGKCWDTVGQVWYEALTGFAPQPNMKMKTFANRTRAVAKRRFPGNAAVSAAVDSGWTAVGL
jgi:Zn-dependent metalloprotease